MGCQGNASVLFARCLALAAKDLDQGAVPVVMKAGAAVVATSFAGLLCFEFGGFGEAAGGVGPGAVELAVVVEPVCDVDPQSAEAWGEFLDSVVSGSRARSCSCRRISSGCQPGPTTDRRSGNC